MSAAQEDFGVMTAGARNLELAAPTPLDHVDGTGLVAIADRPALFKVKGEADLDMGTDGDDVGRSAKDQAVVDMLDSGHGFLVRSVDKPKTEWRQTCEICECPLPTPAPDDAPAWLCQYYDETRPASLICTCAWCRAYQAYLAGMYRPHGGRPRQRCGSSGCERIAARIRKQKSRGTYTPPPPQPEPRRRQWRDGTLPKVLRRACDGSGGRW